MVNLLAATGHINYAKQYTTAADARFTKRISFTAAMYSKTRISYSERANPPILYVQRLIAIAQW